MTCVFIGWSSCSDSQAVPPPEAPPVDRSGLSCHCKSSHYRSCAKRSPVGNRSTCAELAGPRCSFGAALAALRADAAAGQELAREALLEDIERLGGAVDLIVITPVGKAEQLIEVSREPGASRGRKTWPVSNITLRACMRASFSMRGRCSCGLQEAEVRRRSCAMPRPRSASSMIVRSACQSICICSMRWRRSGASSRTRSTWRRWISLPLRRPDGSDRPVGILGQGRSGVPADRA